MTKNSKIITYIIIGLLVLTFGLFYSRPNITSFLTDSGFDSSYSGGGSFGGSSYSGGGSSYSYGGSSYSYGGSSNSSSGSSDGFETFIIFVVIIIIIITSVAATPKGSNTNQAPLRLNGNKAWTRERFSSVIRDITLDKFLQDRAVELIKVQEYWMNFDYDKLRDTLTDELYNQYEMQLKTLSNKGQKNVMKNFKVIEYMVTNVLNDNGRYTVTMEMIISFIDYIEENKKAVRGSNINPITMHYELVFTSSSNGVIEECPNCGAKIEDKNSQKCPYCRSQITQDSTKWVLSKKEAKGQR